MCPHCRAVYQPDEVEIAAFDREAPDRPKQFYTRGPGCNLCSGTGYQGRIGLFETMILTNAIRRMLTVNANSVDIEAQAVKDGMITMRQDGMIKVQKGITSIAEVMRSAFSVAD